MKKLTSIIAVLLPLFIFWGCDKEIGALARFEPTGSKTALLKINYASAYTFNPAVQLKINELRVSNLITGRTPFPGGGFNTGGGSSNDYLSVTPGTSALKISIPNRGAFSDSIILFTGNIALEAGKNYSAHVTDTSIFTKIVVMQDDLTLPDTGRSRYRFVNLMPNVPSIDLYYGSVMVAANVAYLTSSPYFDIIRTASQTWSIREAGSSATSTPLATYLSGNTTIDQRVYTVFASGYKPIAPITPAILGVNRRAYVSFYLVN